MLLPPIVSEGSSSDGKIAAAEALLLENEERHERLQIALARFDNSITLLPDIGHWEWKYRQTERDAVAGIAPASPDLR